jgi:hypothetical protein
MDIAIADLPVAAVLPALAAVLLALSRGPWRVLRTVITIAHEGGHMVTALMVGRRLAGIRLHSDSSGLTLSRGRPTGPGMVATAFAGYVTPSLLGLLIAALVDAGHYTLPLAAGVVLLAAMLVAVRTLFGVVAIIAAGATLVAVRLYTPDLVQYAGATLLAWFLLVGGLRAVVELQRTRRSRGSHDSDADQLARLTAVPALLWVFAFALIGFGALAASVALLVSA